MKLIPENPFEKRHHHGQKIEDVVELCPISEKMNVLQEKIPSNITPPSAPPPSQGVSKDHKAEKSANEGKEKSLKKTFSRILGQTRNSSSAPRLKIENEDFSILAQIHPRSPTQSSPTLHGLKTKQKFPEPLTVKSFFQKAKNLNLQDDALIHFELLLKHTKESKSEIFKEVLNGLTEMANDSENPNANLMAARILAVLIKNSASTTLKILNSLLESDTKEKTLGALKNIILSIKNQEQLINTSSTLSAINDQIDEVYPYINKTEGKQNKHFYIQYLKKVEESKLSFILFLKDIPEIKQNIEFHSDTIKLFKEVIKHFKEREAPKDFESFIFIYKQLSKQIATFEGTINTLEPLLNGRIAKQSVLSNLRLRMHEMIQSDPAIKEENVRSDPAIQQLFQELKRAEKDLYDLEIDRQKAAFSALEPYKFKSHKFVEVKPSFLPEEEASKEFDKLVREVFFKP